MTFSANVRKDSITSSCLHHQRQLIHANVDESLDRFARVDRIDVARRSEARLPMHTRHAGPHWQANVEYTSCYRRRTGYLVKAADHAVTSMGGADVQPCPQFGAEVDIRPDVGYAPPKNTAVRLIRSLRRRVSALKAVLAGDRRRNNLNCLWRTYKSKFRSVIPISLNRLIERLV